MTRVGRKPEYNPASPSVWKMRRSVAKVPSGVLLVLRWIGLTAPVSLSKNETEFLARTQSECPQTAATSRATADGSMNNIWRCQRGCRRHTAESKIHRWASSLDAAMFWKGCISSSGGRCRAPTTRRLGANLDHLQWCNDKRRDHGSNRARNYASCQRRLCR
jgi:hypothetical protein